ncbi:MAG: hypothetical protein KAS72_12760 [Phycisphaerales bacterium]|nr:hypothetical protein [Phycisphaerales bacterium]
MREANITVSRARRALREVRPNTPAELHGWIRAVLGFVIPTRPVMDGHSAPFDYLVHSFFEHSPGPRDAVVWANRGGGKTQLGAITTLLDLLFKPGIQIRILGGSMDQSARMYGYLREFLERDEFQGLVTGKLRQHGVRLSNGSAVELLCQSERSVRGHRVQKLRCDEVELFQSEVWQAAQLVTRSSWCGDVFVRGAIECLSTMHRPFGLMSELTGETSDAAGEPVRRVFKWGLIDVLQRCPPERSCDGCALHSSCLGRAKRTIGHITIEDAIQQRARTGDGTWDAEMLCRRPSRCDAVYPAFEWSRHVIEFHGARDDGLWVGGMDFGYRSPTVVLWGCVDEHNVLWITDEYLARERTIEQHLAFIRDAGRPTLAWIGIDPAGLQYHEHMGTNTATLLRRAGLAPKVRRMRVADGIESVRARLSPADGRTRLLIDPRCVNLIEALERYHYPPDQPDAENPVKDGPDHAADALRYLVTNLDRPGRSVAARGY